MAFRVGYRLHIHKTRVAKRQAEQAELLGSTVAATTGSASSEMNDLVLVKNEMIFVAIMAGSMIVLYSVLMYFFGQPHKHVPTGS